MAEFTAAATRYDRFMGRYATGLAPLLADAAGIEAGMRVLDVGCGPGALAAELARRSGEDQVAAIDPAEQFAAACQERLPRADVRVGAAEDLPWGDSEFDATLASLVVAWMSDADQGIREMARVTRPGGTVAAAMWDFPGGGLTMVATFWRAARELGLEGVSESVSPGASEGDIADRMRRAGLEDVQESTLETSVDYKDFDDFWEPFTWGVASSGTFLLALDYERQGQLRDAVRAALPDGAFTLGARAWFARGTAVAD